VPQQRPPLGLLIRRAIVLRCAWCGDRPGFRRGWFGRNENCRHCGMSVQRGQDGFELGAASVNAILTLGALVVTAGISIVVTYPEVAVRPLLIALGLAAVVLPVVLYPFTYTLWFAIELVMEPPSPADVAAAAVRAEQVQMGA
jgi:hypothetical protein